VPFTYPLSNAVDMRVEDDKEKGCKVVVIEFRWAEYRLELNDKAKAERLLAVFKQAVGNGKKKEQEEVEMPTFYQGVRR